MNGLKIFISITLLLVFQFSDAQSYEGYIDNKYPVWMDLSFSSTNNIISGSYFYKKTGVILTFRGHIMEIN